VDYLAFETKLAHRNPQRTVTNRVYVQIHNRGIQPGTSVTVKILYADASSGLPNLPANFWTAFPGDGTTTFWKPIGAAKTIASISPTRPEILEWDWVPPATAAQHSCLLIVADCAADPIPAAHKVFDIATLVTQDKRVGLRNLHVIDALAGPLWSRIHVWDSIKAADLLAFFPPPKDWSAGVLLPKAIKAKIKSEGLKAGKLTKAQSDELARTLGDKEAKLYDAKDFLAFGPETRATISNFPATKGFDLLLAFLPQRQPARSSFTIVHRAGEKVVGGNTFLLQPKEGA
jgi:hypothetical protein